MKTKHNLRCYNISLNTLVLLCVLTFGALAAARADNFVWNGGGADENWSTSANWDSNVPPATDGSATLKFSGNTRTTSVNDFDADTVFAGITFANDYSSGKTSGFKLSGSGITLEGDVTATLPISDKTITDTISMPIILSGGTRTFTAPRSVSKYHNLTISGSISGEQGLTKDGAGNLTLSSDNTYSGRTTISAGTLYINSIDNVGAQSSALGAPMTVADGTIDLGGTLYYTGGAATSDRAINLTGQSSYGTVQVEGSGCLTLTGDITGSNLNLLLRGNTDIVAQGQIALGSGYVSHTGNGILTLTCPTNSFSGAVTIYAGIISGETISDAGIPSAFGQGSVINLGQQGQGNTGTLQFTGANGGACNRAIKIQASTGIGNGGCIENTVAGQTLILSGDVTTVSKITPNLRLQLIGAGDGEMSGKISDNLALAKNGTGTWVLSGANTYTGATTVIAGTLLINGSTAAGSTFHVDHEGTLGGTGIVYGAVNVAGSGTVSPGNNNDIGTLTLTDTEAGLTLNASTLKCDISGTAGNCDLVALSGPLVLNGANTIALSFPDSTPTAGSYTLMTYPSVLKNGALILEPAQPNYKLVVNETSVTLVISGSSLVWKGDDIANVWDTIAENWSSGTYTDNDAVIFDDTGSNEPAIDISSGMVEPFGVTVDNSVKTYTIAGADGIGGSGGLTKSGTGTLIISCTNTYRGVTALNEGTLALNGSLSNSSINVANGATFTQNASGTIAGDDVNLNILGSATLSGYNTYQGATIIGGHGISNLTVTANHNNALGSTAEGTTVNGENISVSFENKLFLGKDVTITGELLTLASEARGRAALHYAQSSGTGIWDGNIDLPGTSSDTYLWSDYTGGTLVIGSSDEQTITATNGTGSLTIRGNGPIVINSRINIGTTAITRNGSGTWTLNSTNNVWRLTSIAQGTLILGVAEALPATAELKIGKSYPNNHAIFDLNGKHQNVAGLGETYSVGVTTQRIISDAPATLIVSNDTANTFGASGSCIEGAVTLVKSGTSVLTLTGTNTTAGAFIVSNGTLRVSATGTFGVNSTNVIVAVGTLDLQSSEAIADSAALWIENGGAAKVNLEAGVNESVGTLFFGETQKRATTYGATGSSAAVIDDVHFSGSGILTVLHDSSGTVITVR